MGSFLLAQELLKIIAFWRESLKAVFIFLFDLVVQSVPV
jgi:hypothetical protein